MIFIKWLASNIFGEASFLIGVIVLIGLLVQKKELSSIISGVVKAMIGFLIIGFGASLIVQALLVFQPMWKEVFGIDAQKISNYIGQDNFLKQWGSVITLSMTFGFLVNLFLARFTKLKYIYLTGHMMFWTTTIFTGVLLQANPESSKIGLIIFVSLFMGIYWTVQPAITQPLMRKVTGGNSIALGHTSASVAIVSGLIGNLFKKNKVDSEAITVSQKFSFVQDSNVITAITMIILFIVGSIVLFIKKTPAATDVIKMSGDLNFFVYSIKQSLVFTGGIAVVLLGVRMFIGELVPAFKGFAEKIVPNAIPALDCPVVYAFAPNAVILGFLGAFVSGLISLVILGKIGYVFVPTMIVLFFHSATAGVFGNATGGIKGAFVGGIITGFWVAFGQYFMVTFLISSTIPDTALWAGDSDMFLLSWLVRLFAPLL